MTSGKAAEEEHAFRQDGRRSRRSERKGNGSFMNFKPFYPFIPVGREKSYSPDMSTLVRDGTGARASYPESSPLSISLTTCPQRALEPRKVSTRSPVGPWVAERVKMPLGKSWPSLSLHLPYGFNEKSRPL